jgi:hypothetical protein
MMHMCAHARTQLQKQNKFPSLHIVISRFSPPASAHCSPNPAHLNYPFAVWSDQSLFAKPETTAFVTYAFQLARRGLYVPPLDNTTPRCYYIARLKGIYGRGRASLVSSSPFFFVCFADRDFGILRTRKKCRNNERQRE